MKRTTRKNLLQVAAYHCAQDITASNNKATEPTERVLYSEGIYGVTGLLLIGTKTGRYYVIRARSSNLFRYLA